MNEDVVVSFVHNIMLFPAITYIHHDKTNSHAKLITCKSVTLWIKQIDIYNITVTPVTPLLVLSVCLVDSIISSGTCRSTISLMNLFWANPTLMVSTALGLWVDLSLKNIYNSRNLAAATVSTVPFQLSSLKPSWIRREHGRNKSHYHTQDTFTSVACPQYYQWST